MEIRHPLNSWTEGHTSVLLSRCLIIESFNHGWRSWQVQRLRDVSTSSRHSKWLACYRACSPLRQMRSDRMNHVLFTNLPNLLQCTNERPQCRKCISSGRECEGYERERVFITGTPEGRGRVASHPPRVTTPKKDKSKSKSPQPKRESLDKPHVTQAKPHRSAWDQHLDLTNGGSGCSPLLTALHTSLHTIIRSDAAGGHGHGFDLILPPYSLPNLQTPAADPGLWVSAQCLLCHRGVGVQGGSTSSDSYCVFLFEVSRCWTR